MALIYRAIQSGIANKEGEKLWHLSLVKMKDVQEQEERKAQFLKRLAAFEKNN